MPTTIAKPVERPAIKPNELYDASCAMHGEARVAQRHRAAEAAFLQGLAIVVRRWADAEAWAAGV